MRLQSQKLTVGLLTINGLYLIVREKLLGSLPGRLFESKTNVVRLSVSVCSWLAGPSHLRGCVGCGEMGGGGVRGVHISGLATNVFKVNSSTGRPSFQNIRYGHPPIPLWPHVSRPVPTLPSDSPKAGRLGNSHSVAPQGVTASTFVPLRSHHSLVRPRRALVMRSLLPLITSSPLPLPNFQFLDLPQNLITTNRRESQDSRLSAMVDKFRFVRLRDP